MFTGLGYSVADKIHLQSVPDTFDCAQQPVTPFVIYSFFTHYSALLSSSSNVIKAPETESSLL